MTATLVERAAPRTPARRPPGPPPVPAGRPWWPVWAAAAAAVLLRLPFVTAPPGPDEGGYLTVAAQWHPGPSLYGAYWVDRPPLLVSIFWVADHAGGIVALRLLGCLAAAVAVLVVGLTAQRIAGRGPAALAAVVAAVLLASPMAGAGPVNGELLAAPFTAGGIALAVLALRPARVPAPATGPTPTRFAVPWAAVGAGASTAAAVLVKQNLVDAAVFGALTWLLAWRWGRISGRRLGGLLASAVAGAAAFTSVVAVWTVAHGTSLGGVWYAMYPFRLRASHVSTVLTSQELQHRLDVMGALWLGSGTPLLMLALAWMVAGPRRRDPVAWGLLGTVGFAVVSILAGGSYWAHYLVELAVPVALGTSLAVRGRPRSTTSLVALVVVTAAVAWSHVLVADNVDPGAVTGSSIARVAHPRDTIISLLGSANTVQTSGLHSPYPYLWSLPARTLDTQKSLLKRVLRGPHAPTWLIASVHGRATRPRHGTLGPVVRADYHRVARMCGRTVYLHDGLRREAPTAHGCHGPSPLTDLAQQWHGAAH